MQELPLAKGLQVRRELSRVVMVSRKPHVTSYFVELQACLEETCSFGYNVVPLCVHISELMENPETFGAQWLLQQRGFSQQNSEKLLWLCNKFYSFFFYCCYRKLNSEWGEILAGELSVHLSSFLLLGKVTQLPPERLVLHAVMWYWSCSHATETGKKKLNSNS